MSTSTVLAAIASDAAGFSASVVYFKNLLGLIH